MHSEYNEKKVNISDIQDIFETNIGRYAYLRTFYRGDEFIIIRKVDKFNNILYYDVLYNRVWYQNTGIDFTDIIRYDIFDIMYSGIYLDASPTLTSKKCCEYIHREFGTYKSKCVDFGTSCPEFPGYDKIGEPNVPNCSVCDAIFKNVEELLS